MTLLSIPFRHIFSISSYETAVWCLQWLLSSQYNVVFYLLVPAAALWVSDLDNCGPTDQLVRFFCPSCNRNYKEKHNLAKHMRNDCGKAPQFKCPNCLFCTKQKSYVKKHMKYYCQARQLPLWDGILFAQNDDLWYNLI